MKGLKYVSAGLVGTRYNKTKNPIELGIRLQILSAFCIVWRNLIEIGIDSLTCSLVPTKVPKEEYYT